MARVLIVEDGPLGAELAAIGCLLEHHTVALEVGAPAALTRLGAEPFDLILLDLRLPVAAGCRLIEDLMADARSRHLPLLVVTAWAGPWEQGEFLASGATRILTKPYRHRALTDMIDDLLQEALGARQAQGA